MCKCPLLTFGQARGQARKLEWGLGTEAGHVTAARVQRPEPPGRQAVGCQWPALLVRLAAAESAFKFGLRLLDSNLKVVPVRAFRDWQGAAAGSRRCPLAATACQCPGALAIMATGLGVKSLFCHCDLQALSLAAGGRAPGSCIQVRFQVTEFNLQFLFKFKSNLNLKWLRDPSTFPIQNINLRVKRKAALKNYSFFGSTC